MKKVGSLALIAVTGLLCAFTLGLYLGGGSGGSPVTVLPLAGIQVPPTAAAPTQTAPPAETTAPTEQAAETTAPAEQTDVPAQSTVPPAPSGSTAGQSAGLININTATVAELKALPGIGDVIAQRIVDYRTAHGRFSSIEELMNVSGIGEKRFAAIRDLVTVGG